MKLAFICDNEQESAALMEFMRQRSAGAPQGAPQGAPPGPPPMQPVPPPPGPPPAYAAPPPPPAAAPASPPPPPPPPPAAAAPPAGITQAHVMAAMQAYKQKVGDPAVPYVQQLFQQAGVTNLATATQGQIEWLHKVISGL